MNIYGWILFIMLGIIAVVELADFIRRIVINRKSNARDAMLIEKLDKALEIVEHFAAEYQLAFDEYHKEMDESNNEERLKFGDED